MSNELSPGCELWGLGAAHQAIVFCQLLRGTDVLINGKINVAHIWHEKVGRALALSFAYTGHDPIRQSRLSVEAMNTIITRAFNQAVAVVKSECSA